VNNILAQHDTYGKASVFVMPCFKGTRHLASR